LMNCEYIKRASCIIINMLPLIIKTKQGYQNEKKCNN